MMKEQRPRISDAETREMQQYLLDILTSIHSVCQAHGLRYYLIAGTMLGAVRHQGFVPWDDDADVAMPRKDYDRLVAHANEWLPPHLELVSGVQDSRYPYAFARIQNKNTTYILRRCFNFAGGLPVDVFPLDGMTRNPLARYIHYRRYDVLIRLMYFAQRDPYKHGRGLGCLFIKLCHRLFSQSWLHRRLDALQRQYSIEKTGFVADHDNKPCRGILPREVYGTPTPVSFCGHALMGVQNPDRYLRYCYGDYMTPPPQLPPQNFRHLDLTKPYREYKKEHPEYK
ncbi:LicD family protein [Segatella baroniae]|uniref:LicD family protein n=1 Tax=Segatella baroniae TaxID=305719 RepID=UPI0028ECCBCD|nr:LicD family protein [Segatella baroniae]